MTNNTDTLTPKYTRRRSLSVPLMSLKHSPHIHVKVVGEMRAEDMPGLTNAVDKQVTVVPVIDLDTGEDKILLCLAMLVSALRHVPDTYVGQCFEIQSNPPAPGKNYNTVDVWLIDCPASHAAT